MTDPEEPARTELELPPEPASTGATLVQRQPSGADAAALVRLPEGLETGSGIRPLSLTGAVTQLLDGGIKGTAAMMLLQVSTERVEEDLVRTREQCEGLRQASDGLKDALHVADKDNAVLNERLSSERLKKAVASIGTLVLGFTVPTGNLPGVVLGAGLVLIGWFWPRARKK